MEWWQGIWGWGVTTALAALAAVVAVIALWIQEVRYRRGLPTMRIGVGPYVDLKSSDGEQWRVFRLMNLGSATLETVLEPTVVGAVKAYPDGDRYKLPVVLKAHEEYQFAVEHADTSRAWVLITVIHPHRRGWAATVWRPLEPQGALEEEFLRQGTAARSALRRRARRLSRTQPPVAPGGVLAATYRMRDTRRALAAAAAATAGQHRSR